MKDLASPHGSEPACLAAGTGQQPSADRSAGSAERRPGLIGLLPVVAAVFIAYLVIGLAMPVLPLHVHRGLGLGTFMVGVVAGSQFAAALGTRLWAGRHVDTRGARSGIVIGSLVMAAAGLLYLLSLRFVGEPRRSVAVLLAGRALVGAAESFVITGALGWGLALAGPDRSGRVMAWVGTALYAALAVGAPAGSALYGRFGFVALAWATAAVPLLTLPLVAWLRPAAVSPAAPAGLIRVARAVWAPGLGLALSGVGFGAITTFVVLLFAEHGWGPAWAAFTALGTTFVAGRVCFGHLPDRMGGARVALVSTLLEAAGLTLIWLAPAYAAALAGVALSGLGYSLVYPGFGVEAVRRVPPQSRGLAMGAYTAFLDLSLGVSGPALGLVAARAGLASVFLVSTLAVLAGAAVAWRLPYALREPPGLEAAGSTGDSAARGPSTR